MRRVIVAVLLVVFDWVTFIIPIGSIILAIMIIWKPKELFKVIEDL